RHAIPVSRNLAPRLRGYYGGVRARASAITLLSVSVRMRQPGHGPGCSVAKPSRTHSFAVFRNCRAFPAWRTQRSWAATGKRYRKEAMSRFLFGMVALSLTMESAHAVDWQCGPHYVLTFASPWPGAEKMRRCRDVPPFPLPPFIFGEQLLSLTGVLAAHVDEPARQLRPPIGLSARG